MYNMYRYLVYNPEYSHVDIDSSNLSPLAAQDPSQLHLLRMRKSHVR